MIPPEFRKPNDPLFKSLYVAIRNPGERVRSQKGVTPKGVLVRISDLAEANQRG